jgi:hypothetical protein
MSADAVRILETYNTEEQLTDSDVDIDDDEADAILDTLRGTDTNNGNSNDNSDDDNYSLNSEEAAIYEVEADMEAGLI